MDIDHRSDSAVTAAKKLRTASPVSAFELSHIYPLGAPAIDAKLVASGCEHVSFSGDGHRQWAASDVHEVLFGHPLPQVAAEPADAA